jgi:Zn-dependent protease
MTSMRLAWKLGRVAGIDFYVHPTFLVVFFLFPRVFPGGALSPLNILLVLGVFGCVLLHELGHALMARRFGISTHDITLYPIGGVARLERMPRAPGAELLIALAGPAVNFAIVLGLIALFLVGGDLVNSYSWVATFLQQVLIVNLVLGLFNLIPAFPMDGGRVLRALLSGWLGRVRATMAAARIGRALAVVFGVLSLANNPIEVALVHVALAMFIYMAAKAEEAQVVAEDRSQKGFGVDNSGIWTAPPGYYWVRRGNGLWQLAPISVGFGDPTRSAPRWR